MLPINTLREIQKLFPTHASILDDWQRKFTDDQIKRLEKWGDDVHLSEKQAVALQKILTVLQKAEVEGEQGSEA